MEYRGCHETPSPSARCRPECSSRVREAIATYQEMLRARHCGHEWRRCLRWILLWVYDDGWGRNRHALTALGRRQTAVSSPFLASLNTRGQPCAPPRAARRGRAPRMQWITPPLSRAAPRPGWLAAALRCRRECQNEVRGGKKAAGSRTTREEPSRTVQERETERGRVKEGAGERTWRPLGIIQSL
eukprot:COSAG03_NODE_360_length_8585_cov_69.712350_2_plen_186_part_00